MHKVYRVKEEPIWAYYTPKSAGPVDRAVRLRDQWDLAVRLMGLRVRIPPGAWMSNLSVIYRQVEVSATGRSFVQRSPSECGVSECDRKASIMRKPWAIRGCRATKKKPLSIGYTN